MTTITSRFFPSLLLPEARVASNIEMHSHAQGASDHG